MGSILAFAYAFCFQPADPVTEASNPISLSGCLALLLLLLLLLSLSVMTGRTLRIVSGAGSRELCLSYMRIYTLNLPFGDGVDPYVRVIAYRYVVSICLFTHSQCRNAPCLFSLSCL